MNKDNNNKSWPYQKFHNANKSSNRSNPIWSLHFYEYNNSGEIEKLYIKWGPKTAHSPASYVDKAFYTSIIRKYNSLIINLGS
ncbi:MAG: hypothetical protein ACR5KV_04085 [Wolbachia sp.]